MRRERNEDCREVKKEKEGMKADKESAFNFML
jgi:hypothetical protein